jgi:chemosensory pili system protein ChpA (sensor histidine kinase/response regulator)
VAVRLALDRARDAAVAQTLVYDPAVRSRMDQAVLRIVKSGRRGRGTSSSAASAWPPARRPRQPKIFWKLCAGYFEALARNLLPVDVYVKRAASRVLLQYATLAKGEQGVSDRLAQDLLFFCAQAVPANPADAPALAAVREAYGLGRFKPVDYQTAVRPLRSGAAHAGAQAHRPPRKPGRRCRAAMPPRSSGVGDQFHCHQRLAHQAASASGPLAQALSAGAVDGVVRAASRPDRSRDGSRHRGAVPRSRLPGPRPHRLAAGRAHRAPGRAPRPGAPGRPGRGAGAWMEELYRKVSDRQTMGSVVGELRGTLGELEKVLDAVLPQPAGEGSLKRRAQPPAADARRAVGAGPRPGRAGRVRMRETGREHPGGRTEEEQAKARGRSFEKLGNNLGALGFLIDMLNYQPRWPRSCSSTTTRKASCVR